MSRLLAIASLGSAVALWLGLSCSALAAPTQSLDSVRAAAEQALREHYAQPGSRIEVTTEPLDLRLKLAACGQPLRALVSVHAEQRDVTRLGYGYIENFQQIAGRSLARAVPRGTVLSPGTLGGRRMVRAGDHVQVLARLDGIEVRAEGIALGSGDNGARLRVRNASSGRVVDAMVNAPGVVVALP